jgi:hypothetical protein
MVLKKKGLKQKGVKQVYGVYWTAYQLVIIH